jgi:hypothetical protein
MIDINVIIPILIEKSQTANYAYRLDILARDASIRITSDIHRLFQVIAIKLINKSAGIASSLPSSQFAQVMGYIVAEVKDEIQEDQDSMRLEGLNITETETLLNLSLSGYDNTNRAIKVAVITAAQEESFNIAFNS